MKPKQLHDKMFDLFDIADYLYLQIQEHDEDSQEYFLALVFIEKIFDTFGRGLAFRSAVDAKDPELDSAKSSRLANDRLARLRTNIDDIKKHGKLTNIDQILEHYAEQLQTEWPHSQ